MMPVCLKIGEDELFSTWLTALAEANHMSLSEFGQIYLGYQPRTQWAAQVYLRNVEEVYERHSDMALFPDIFQILKQHMPYGVMQIGMSRQAAARQVEAILRNYSSEGGMYKKPVRYCPICALEDMQQYGRRIAHVPHQLRDITVCWKHGCALEGEAIDEQRVETEMRIARYAHDLYKLQLGAGIEQTFQCLETYMQEHHISGYSALVNLIADAGYGTDVNTYQSQIELRHMYAVKCIFRLLAYMYPEVSDLRSRLSQSGCRPVDTAEFRVLEADAGVGRYQCKACGHIFYSHEKAIEAGLLCPACRNGMDEQAYRERLISRFHDGEYEWVDRDHIRHKPCGTEKKAGPLFWLRDKECGGCQSYTLQDWQRLWKDTEYEVKDITSLHGKRHLVVRHKPCNCEFSLPVPIRWLNNKITDVAFCPRCEKRVRRFSDVQRQKDRVGQYAMASTGIGMTVIQYKSSFEVLVRFDNGLERWTTWQVFKKIQEQKVHQYPYREFYIGVEKVMKDGQHCVIVDYKGNRSVRVRFDDGIEIEGSYRAFRHGSMRHP